MNIFYLGNFELPHRTENYVSWAFNTLGVNVKKRQVTKSMTLAIVKNQIKTYNPDVVLFSKNNIPWFKELIHWCKTEGILTVCWIFDLMWGLPRSNKFAKLPQYKTDVLFATDGGNQKNWEQVGANQVTVRQGIHLPEAFLAEPLPYKVPELAFIGTNYSHGGRRLMINWMRGYYGHRFHHYNNVRGVDLNRLLASTQLVIGDSYPSENYWSNRAYEILGRGGVLLHPDTVGLDKEFNSGEHYFRFKRIVRKADFISLQRKINLLLENPDNIKKVRLQGFNLVSQNYTYVHRCLEILRHLSYHTDSLALPHSESVVAPALGCGEG